jgi:hypothetical protein
LYEAYQRYIRPLPYEISVVYNDKQFVQKLTEIPLRSSKAGFYGTKLHIGEETLQTLNTNIYCIDFWKPPYGQKTYICYEYKASIDFSKPSVPNLNGKSKNKSQEQDMSLLKLSYQKWAQNILIQIYKGIRIYIALKMIMFVFYAVIIIHTVFLYVFALFSIMTRLLWP